MMLIIFVTTILVLCTSMFAMMAIVPMMVENRTARRSPDNLLHLPRATRGSGHTGSTAA